jgi:hypothetical protein
MKRILLFAAFLYLFISPLTYHPDNKAVLFWASSANGTVWNIWEYGERYLAPNQQYNYPPFHFYLDKLQFLIAKPLGGPGFVEWLNTPHQEDFFQPLLARYMVASKFSLILFGLLAGYLIYKLAKQFGLSELRSRIAAGVWLFNPVTLYSIPMMGQNDVMAIVFFLGGWLLLFRHPKIAAVIFGLAGSIKTFPLIWLAFLLPATSGISRKMKVVVFLLSVFVYGLTLVPFLHNPTFISVGMNSEINSRFLIPQINIGFDQAIYVVPVLLAMVIFTTTVSPAVVVLTANLLLLGFSHFHPQWYIWTVPFFALWLVTQKKKDTIFASVFLALITVASWIAVIIFFADKYLSFGIIGVANPAMGNLPVLREALLIRGVNVGMYDNLAHTALAAVGVIVLMAIISKQYIDRSTDFSIKIFDKCAKCWIDYSKFFRVIIIATISTIVFVAWIGVMQIIPAPISTPPLSNENYVAVDNSVKGKFQAGQNNLYRFDLLLSNPRLSNIGKYQVTLSSNNRLLHQQTISGLNIGKDETIRFDLPEVQKNSKGQIYDIKFLALEGTISATSIKNNPEYILASVSRPNKQDSLAIQQFFKPSRNVNDILTRVNTKIQQIFFQLPWYYLGLFVLLCLWV